MQDLNMRKQKAVPQDSTQEHISSTHHISILQYMRNASKRIFASVVLILSADI